jgi:hypothetical protein
MVNYPEPHQEVEPHEGGVDSDSKPLKFKPLKFKNDI